MNCPFCGTLLSKVAAICPSCKNPLPEANLIPYYSAALARDKTLAQADKRAALDAIVKKEAEARTALLNEARERARVEQELEREERLRRAEEQQARYASEAEASRLRREAFLARNSKKLILWGTVAVLGITASAVTINALQPKPIPVAAPAPEVRVEPCTALGSAAKETVVLINRTFDESFDSNLSVAEITALGELARSIQGSLLSSTIGQASDLPKIEGAVLTFSNALGSYRKALVALRSNSSELSSVTGPLQAVTKQAQKVCQSSGFLKQFNDASGWK